MSSPSLYAVGAGARTKRMRIGPMGYIVPLYHPLRLAEEIAIVDQMLGGRMELGLVPGINPDYFRPFGLDYGQRKSPTLEFVDYLRAAFGDTQPFSFHGAEFHTDNAQISVPPSQRPHPPLWMMSRDPQTLEFCARNAISPGYFLVYPRADAAPRYRKFLAVWRSAGHARKPNIAYCSICYVDDSDDKAIENALFRASRAYEGFLDPAKPGETFDQRAREHAKRFIGRGEPGASEIMQHLFDADYLYKHDLVFIGSAETVAKKIRAAAAAGVFNVFMGEFNFADLPEDALHALDPAVRREGDPGAARLRTVLELPLPACGERVGLRGPLRRAQNCGNAPSPSIASLTRPLPAQRGAVNYCPCANSGCALMRALLSR